MQSVDLNLLVVLDALLQEGSVNGAARRLHLTPPAVSRSLGRLRVITGDPLLVRAGRNLVPTPAADDLRQRTHDLVAAVHEVLRPAQAPSDEELERSLHRVFRLRMGPDNAGAFGPALFEEMHGRAPRVGLHLVGDDDRAAESLRDGQIDLALGSPIAGNADTLHREALLTDKVVIVARRDGAFARTRGRAQPTIDDLASHLHVNRFPESAWHRAVDHHLVEQGLTRTVAATAPGFAAAFALVRSADLICLAPERLTRSSLGADLRNWPSPIPLPDLVIEQCWHHRSHSDPEHRWLRDRVRSAVSSSTKLNGAT